MILARLIAGACVLFLGRKLFWLFVGLVGFVLGMDLAALMFHGLAPLQVFLIALGGGLVGAVLAVAIEEVMVGIAGFLAGAYIAAQILVALAPYPGRDIWVAMLVGGFLGLLLLLSVFDWALITLSSVIGAGFIIQTVPERSELTYVAFFVLVIIGMIIQARIKDREHLPQRIR